MFYIEIVLFSFFLIYLTLYLYYIKAMKNYYVLILISASIMILFYGRIDISKAPFSDIPDIHNYRLMAQASPGFDETVSRNFGYRILTPYIAGLMPFDIDMNFYILTIIFSLIIPFVFFRFLKVYGLSDDTSFYLTLLFLAGRHSFGFPVWDYYDIHDLLTHILILLFLIAVKKNNFFVLAFILSVGVINRETILFLVPPYVYFYFFIDKNRRKAVKFVLSVIPALIILTVIRSLLITESKESSDILYSLGKLRFDESNKLFNPVTYYRIINTFIPLTFIPFVFWKTTKDFFKKNMHFLVLIFIYTASCFLAGDTERLIVPVFPVFFLLLGIIFEKERFISIKGKMLILMIAIASIPHHIYFRYNLPDRNCKVALSLIALSIVTFYFLKLKKDNKKCSQ